MKKNTTMKMIAIKTLIETLSTRKDGRNKKFEEELQNFEKNESETS